MTDLILKLLGTGLSLWESKEKRKYLDKFLKLKKEYYEEINKPIVDDAALDVLDFELQLLGQAFSSSASKQDPANK